MKINSRDIRRLKAHRNPTKFVQIGRDSRAPVQQNATEKYTVFGSVQVLNVFADVTTRIALPDEVELEGIDEHGGHFTVARYGCAAFEMLAYQYGLSVRGGRVV